MSAIGQLWYGNCEETRVRLSDHLEGELVGRRAKRDLRHLARCERCREVLHSLARAVELLRSLGRRDLSSPSSSLADAVLQRIRREEADGRSP